jgi:NADP-dependent 3-hydroxy acid dehydrogenase YdfG
MTQASESVALITGASSGIGRATALAFAQAGFSLQLVSRAAERLEPVVNQATAYGVSVRACPLDLAAVATIRPRLTTFFEEHGTPDVVINNAGMAYTGALAEMPLPDWQQLFDLNLTSVLQCIQAVLPGMRQKGTGLIVNVASIAAKQAFPDWGAYCASKAALLALSKVVAMEERAHGIRVSVISPGSVRTGIWDTPTVHVDFDRSSMLDPEVVAQAILQLALVPPAAVVEEITLLPSVGTF